MLLNDEKIEAVWERVYNELKFRPSCEYCGHSLKIHVPFEINGDYEVYAVDTENWQDSADNIIRKIFIDIADGGKLYALDWQHSSFLFDPRSIEEQQSFRVNDERYFGGGYTASFPAFCPDGDYYFFIDEHFRFGYLGHPWRQEIWLFGSELIEKFEEAQNELGWTKLDKKELI